MGIDREEAWAGGEVNFTAKDLARLGAERRNREEKERAAITTLLVRDVNGNTGDGTTGAGGCCVTGCTSPGLIPEEWVYANSGDHAAWVYFCAAHAGLRAAVRGGGEA